MASSAGGRPPPPHGGGSRGLGIRHWWIRGRRCAPLQPQPPPYYKAAQRRNVSGAAAGKTGGEAAVEAGVAAGGGPAGAGGGGWNYWWQAQDYPASARLELLLRPSNQKHGTNKRSEINAPEQTVPFPFLYHPIKY